jgi:hypothetical protein
VRLHQAAEPSRIRQQRRLLLAADDRDRNDRRARGHRHAHEAFAQRREAVPLVKAAIVRAGPLRKRQHCRPVAQQRDAGRARAVDRADAPCGASEDRQLHQPMIGHRAHEPRRLGLEQARGQDVRAVEGERVRAVIGGEQHASLGQVLETLGLRAEVVAIEPSDEPVLPPSRSEIEAMPLGRYALEGARALEPLANLVGEPAPCGRSAG